jgi:hypothetical protein
MEREEGRLDRVGAPMDVTRGVRPIMHRPSSGQTTTKNAPNTPKRRNGGG